MGEQVSYSLPESVEANTAGNQLAYLAEDSFTPVLSATALDSVQRVALFAQMVRYNTLYMVSRAGSGHLGGSFSSLDIVSWLYLQVLRPSDRYYSSKGHDSPGLYAVHTALGIQPFERIHQLRRLGGLPGHPDVGSPGAFTNTGSLGMGISKAKGFMLADDLAGRQGGRVFVLTGDGELQEGQIWESLIGAARLRNGRLTFIVDHNKVQSDTFVDKVSDLGDLAAKFAAFGCEVRRIDGHDLAAIRAAVDVPAADGRPVAVIADTIKGRGVSFMEHTAMAPDQDYYRFHSGAPTPEDYRNAAAELLADIYARCLAAGLPAPVPTPITFEPVRQPEDAERMIPAYTEAILDAARCDGRIVALDADLVLDTGLIPFKNEFGARFVECGIAEQDMVSQAGTLALAGMVPVVHSFSCFLTTRPTEQIYNNCTEGTKIVYVGSLSGVVPAGPGHSHQSVRDMATMSGLPDMVIVEPLCADQVGPALRWALDKHKGSTYLRLTSVPYTRRPELKNCGSLVEGRGHVLRHGATATLVVTSPVLMVEALKAADALAVRGVEITVIGMPWLNRIDASWFGQAMANGAPLLTLENHFVEGGFGMHLVTSLAEAGLLPGPAVHRLGMRVVPASGRNDEVLLHHGLDAASLADHVMSVL